MAEYHILRALTPKQKKSYLDFRRALYRGDRRQVATSEAAVRSFLYRETRLANDCDVVPLLAVREERPAAECMLLAHPALPVLQVAFFEAEEGKPDAVNLLLNAAIEEAKSRGLPEVVVGLNGHTSCGAGILAEGFEFKNSLGGIYNKPYYAEYFRSLGLRREKLGSFRGELNCLRHYVRDLPARVSVRHADETRFEEETELVRRVCERAEGRNALYFPTKCGQFFELALSMRSLLKSENLLIAESEGDAVGFLFWYPDFNQLVPGGKRQSMLSVKLAAELRGDRVDAFKIGGFATIGENGGRIMHALLSELKALVSGRFCFAETNSVWEQDERLFGLCKRAFGRPFRNYEVYFMDVPFKKEKTAQTMDT